MPLTITRRLIKQKARHHPCRALTPCKHIISGIYFTPLAAVLFTFPSRYLFTIGRQLVFSLTPWSPRIHTKFHVHRVTQEFPRRARVFGYGPLTLCGAIFHSLHLTVCTAMSGSYNPHGKPWVWALPLSLATTYGIDSLSFPLVTEMFHFTGYCVFRAMYSHGDDRVLPRPGYPIRKSTGQSVFAAIRRLSQLITSFIAYWHQGIHHVLFVA